MLDPNDRHVYLEVLKPPDGYLFGEGIATTYSLDLTTLLSVPVALVLPHLEAGKLKAEHTVDLLHAIQQASSRLTIFCDSAGVCAPPPGILYSLLEPVVVQARALHGGVLHAKFWLIRFDPIPGEKLEPCMRLIVLSRNLTNDRSWDVSVSLDGDLGGRRRATNNPLVQLLEKLPSCAVQPMAESAQTRVAQLAEQVSKTEWELPEGFEELTFHALGIGAKPKSWIPAPSDRLVVISPFVSPPALKSLQASTREPIALIARGEELDRCEPSHLKGFAAIHVLSETTACEDGEDTSTDESTIQLRGLHAKVFVAKRGWNTHVYLGSANATTNALIAGRNIELMVELSGRTSAVPGNGIDGLLATTGLGAMLSPYEAPTTPPETDGAAEKADEALRNAAQLLAQAGLSLQFDRNGDEYVPALHIKTPIVLSGVAQARAWLITNDPSNARSIDGLSRGESVLLAPCDSASATTFVGFDLWAEAANLNKQFVLNLPTLSMPADRDAQIVRAVVKNRDRLMQYILGLLRGSDPFVRAGLEPKPGAAAWAHASNLVGSGLLEQLIRTKARHPERLDEVRAVLQALTATAEGREIVPPELASLWTILTGEVLG